MNKKIKLLLLSLGFGLLAVFAKAECPCTDPNVCPPNDPNNPPSDSMPATVIVDDMATDVFAAE